MFDKKKFWLLSGFLQIFMLTACSQATAGVPLTSDENSIQPVLTEVNFASNRVASTTPAETEIIYTEIPDLDQTSTPTNTPSNPQVEVVAVNVGGAVQAYTFSVEVRSPDQGCNQYADWWEVITLEGELIYRRILLHSHVNEQPFTRSGGPVTIGPDEVVIIRAHMNPGGYGSQAIRGSVVQGFEPIELRPDFAPALDRVAPLPEECDF